MSSYPGGGGTLAGWEWNFGSDATPSTANTQGPHTVTYSTDGPRTITLTVESDQGCLITTTQTIDVTSCCPIDATVDTFADPACGGNDGAIAISVANATLPIAYNWNPNVSTTDIATGLIAGTYEITVTDADGCTDTVSQTLVDTTIELEATATPNSICIGQSSQLNVPVGATSYTWFPAATLSNATIANPIATPTTTTTYGRGCFPRP